MKRYDQNILYKEQFTCVANLNLTHLELNRIINWKSPVVHLKHQAEVYFLLHEEKHGTYIFFFTSIHVFLLFRMPYHHKIINISFQNNFSLLSQDLRF